MRGHACVRLGHRTHDMHLDHAEAYLKHGAGFWTCKSSYECIRFLIMEYDPTTSASHSDPDSRVHTRPTLFLKVVEHPASELVFNEPTSKCMWVKPVNAVKDLNHDSRTLLWASCSVLFESLFKGSGFVKRKTDV
ncbi:hypothetical protein VNO77_04424 [Canavalia gladiata]|uniref:Uncharacterized protein n=1 Tax=Canavalia gladiata TaxID=3824 RepID=A0AAN9R921_CANGL